MTQFTANEVRTESCKQGQLHRQPASDMLNAFADMLEAREKAVPVELDFYDAGLLNDFGGGNVIWWWDYMRDELGRAHSFYQSQVNDMMLVAHSAQAQPPAASVTEEMVERARSAFVQADDGSTGITDAIRAALLAAQENPNG